MYKISFNKHYLQWVFAASNGKRSPLTTPKLRGDCESRIRKGKKESSLAVQKNNTNLPDTKAKMYDLVRLIELW